MEAYQTAAAQSNGGGAICDGIAKDNCVNVE